MFLERDRICENSDELSQTRGSSQSYFYYSGELAAILTSAKHKGDFSLCKNLACSIAGRVGEGEKVLLVSLLPGNGT